MRDACINGADGDKLRDGNQTAATSYMDEFSGHDDVKKFLGYVRNADEEGFE